MKRIGNWLDQRTGYRAAVKDALYENIPGGSRWRYVWGSTLTFTLVVQMITGIFLWFGYSPSSQTAWESVYYIQHEMLGGWLLRGLHHFTAQAMNVLLVLHLMQVVIDGAYKAPREVNFWFGFFMLQLVLALSLTGYLLPWDQKGYWATKVTTDIMGIVPVAGPWLQRLVVGGSDYGHHTLTRFFALHAGVLPAAIVGLLVAHIYLFRRHGITARDPQRKPDQKFWPDQVLKDAVACLAVLAVVLFFIVRPRLFDASAPMGAELTAPAEPSEEYSAARPEWYFLFLFQFLKYFPGQTEVIGAIIIPSLIMGLVFLMPIVGQWRLGHRFNLGLLFSLLAGIALLTYLALASDRENQVYQAAVKDVHRASERVRVLAQAPAGIPSGGAALLLRQDPWTQGPRIFARNCASCHRFDGHDGLGQRPVTVHLVKTNETLTTIAAAYGMSAADIKTLNPGLTTEVSPAASVTVYDVNSASDLKGFGSRTWIAGLLDPARVSGPQYFGGTKFTDGKMARFVKKDVQAFSAAEKIQLERVVVALSAEAGLKGQKAIDARDRQLIEEGRALIASDTMRCTECHTFGKADEDATAPELTGYGSRAWLVDFISDPAHARFYGKRNDRMPIFGSNQLLDRRSIELVADWLRGDWYEPADGANFARRARLDPGDRLAEGRGN